jgi:mRNA interferase MazF
MTTKPGEVYQVDLGLRGKVRYMIVLSREDADAPRALSVCAPVTTAYRRSAYEVELPQMPFLREKSYANVQGMQAIQHHELSSRPVGSVTGMALERVYQAVKHLFNHRANKTAHSTRYPPGVRS